MSADTAARKKWGDSADDGELEKDGKFLHDEEPDVDENGIKTMVEYTTNEKGQKVKLIKKFKVYKKHVRINKLVEMRRRWKKFGECAGLPPGPEKVITSLSEEIFLDLNKSKGDKDQGKDSGSAGSKDPVLSAIVCRNCGKVGDHWTLKCPLRGSLAAAGADFGRASPNDAPLAPSAPGKYQPPGRRVPGGPASAGSAPGDYGDRRRDEVATTIRVTNLSEDTKEGDLQELFRPFGPVSRIYLAKDKHTGLSKGFAFINFIHREDAARAIDKLQGYGYDHLILHLEWAKPSVAP